MSEIANSEGASESEKPVHNDDVQFPPFPDPKDEDFDEDIGEEERIYYKTTFKDLNMIKSMRLHCSACDRHMGCSARNESRMRVHPMLRTLVCHNCHIFYNSGEFEKGDDGSELYCRWCGQGGQVYCCSDCPHVFCAVISFVIDYRNLLAAGEFSPVEEWLIILITINIIPRSPQDRLDLVRRPQKCIKRNLGAPKIKEIENADDWKCFKCNSRCLWDLRALCWAVLRYCDLKNKMAYQTQDLQLREAYKKDCSIDYSECCKNKSNKRTHKIESTKKKEKEVKKETDAKLAANIISKIPSTIQVKKFAALNIDDTVKQEKKAQKRSSSPKNKPVVVKNPINIAPPKALNPVSVPPVAKKMKLPNSPMVNTPIRLLNPNDRKTVSTYARIRPKPLQLPMPIANNTFNGFSASLYSSVDNINLSLENLTQGLDMAAVSALSRNTQDDDVVCTPDFPLEPLCEVTEDNDDDVQCITPGPVVAPKLVNPPPLVPRSTNSLSMDASSENIIQMTDNDVTVNAATGGLKFRVDPQTLSSNKMYRLPDGRIFAINANPNMPGGYSATIVAVTEPTGKAAPKGATYAAKLSAVTTSSPAPAVKASRNQPRILKRSTPKTAKVTRSTETSSRECDLNVPVEWYRYNLIDAVDALEYALSRLNKLKKEATTVYLRTRSVNEMRNLHRTLERLLNTSSCRFGEIRDNLNKGLKQYVARKSGGNISDDDDDVEILPDMDDNDDPIFIDENSVESTMNSSENQEVDLTGAGSSEYNDSGDNTKDNNFSKSVIDPLNVCVVDHENSEHGDVISDSHNDSINTSENKFIDEDNHKKSKTDKNVKKNESNAKENETDKNVKENKIEKKEKGNEVEKYEKANEVEQDEEGNDTDSVIKERETKNNVREIKIDNNVIDNKTDDDIKENVVDNNVNNNDTETEVQKKETANNVKDNEIDNDGTENKSVKPISDQLNSNETIDELNGEIGESTADKQSKNEDCLSDKDLNDKADSQDSDDKMQDSEISEEMIEKLLKDDNLGDESATNPNSMDVSEIIQET